MPPLSSSNSLFALESNWSRAHWWQDQQKLVVSAKNDGFVHVQTAIQGIPYELLGFLTLGYASQLGIQVQEEYAIKAEFNDEQKKKIQEILGQRGKTAKEIRQDLLFGIHSLLQSPPPSTTRPQKPLDIQPEEPVIPPELPEEQPPPPLSPEEAIASIKTELAALLEQSPMEVKSGWLGQLYDQAQGFIVSLFPKIQEWQKAATDFFSAPIPVSEEDNRDFAVLARYHRKFGDLFSYLAEMESLGLPDGCKEEALDLKKQLYGLLGRCQWMQTYFDTCDALDQGLEAINQETMSIEEGSLSVSIDNHRALLDIVQKFDALQITQDADPKWIHRIERKCAHQKQFALEALDRWTQALSHAMLVEIDEIDAHFSSACTRNSLKFFDDLQEFYKATLCFRAIQDLSQNTSGSPGLEPVRQKIEILRAKKYQKQASERFCRNLEEMPSAKEVFKRQLNKLQGQETDQSRQGLEALIFLSELVARKEMKSSTRTLVRQTGEAAAKILERKDTPQDTVSIIRANRAPRTLNKRLDLYRQKAELSSEYSPGAQKAWRLFFGYLQLWDLLSPVTSRFIKPIGRRDYQYYLSMMAKASQEKSVDYDHYLNMARSFFGADQEFLDTYDQYLRGEFSIGFQKFPASRNELPQGPSIISTAAEMAESFLPATMGHWIATFLGQGKEGQFAATRNEWEKWAYHHLYPSYRDYAFDSMMESFDKGAPPAPAETSSDEEILFYLFYQLYQSAKDPAQRKDYEAHLNEAQEFGQYAPFIEEYDTYLRSQFDAFDSSIESIPLTTLALGKAALKKLEKDAAFLTQQIAKEQAMANQDRFVDALEGHDNNIQEQRSTAKKLLKEAPLDFADRTTVFQWLKNVKECRQDYISEKQQTRSTIALERWQEDISLEKVKAFLETPIPPADPLVLAQASGEKFLYGLPLHGVAPLHLLEYRLQTLKARIAVLKQNPLCSDKDAARFCEEYLNNPVFAKKAAEAPILPLLEKLEKKLEIAKTLSVEFASGDSRKFSRQLKKALSSLYEEDSVFFSDDRDGLVYELIKQPSVWFSYYTVRTYTANPRHGIQRRAVISDKEKLLPFREIVDVPAGKLKSAKLWREVRERSYFFGFRDEGYRTILEKAGGTPQQNDNDADFIDVSQSSNYQTLSLLFSKHLAEDWPRLDYEMQFKALYDLKTALASGNTRQISALQQSSMGFASKLPLWQRQRVITSEELKYASAFVEELQTLLNPSRETSPIQNLDLNIPSNSKTPFIKSTGVLAHLASTIDLDKKPQKPPMRKPYKLEGIQYWNGQPETVAAALKNLGDASLDAMYRSAPLVVSTTRELIKKIPLDDEQFWENMDSTQAQECLDAIHTIEFLYAKAISLSRLPANKLLDPLDQLTNLKMLALASRLINRFQLLDQPISLYSPNFHEFLENFEILSQIPRTPDWTDEFKVLKEFWEREKQNPALKIFTRPNPQEDLLSQQEFPWAYQWVARQGPEWSNLVAKELHLLGEFDDIENWGADFTFDYTTAEKYVQVRIERDNNLPCTEKLIDKSISSAHLPKNFLKARDLFFSNSQIHARHHFFSPISLYLDYSLSLMKARGVNLYNIFYKTGSPYYFPSNRCERPEIVEIFSRENPEFKSLLAEDQTSHRLRLNPNEIPNVSLAKATPLGLKEKHAQDLLNLSTIPELQVQETLSYFTRHIELLGESRYRYLLKYLLFEPGLLADEFTKLPQDNQKFVNDLSAFCQTALTYYETTKDIKAISFILELTHLLGQHIESIQKQRPSCLPADFSPSFLDARAEFRRLLSSSGPSFEERAILHCDLARTYSAQSNLSKEEAVELITQVASYRLYSIPEEAQEPRATSEMSLALKAKSEQLESIFSSPDSHAILHEIYHQFRPEASPVEWDPKSKFPVFKSIDGKVEIDVLDGILVENGGMTKWLPQKILSHDAFVNLFGKHEKFVSTELDDSSGYLVLGPNKQTYRLILVESEKSDSLVVQMQFDDSWYQLDANEDQLKNLGVLDVFIDYYRAWVAVPEKPLYVPLNVTPTPLFLEEIKQLGFDCSFKEMIESTYPKDDDIDDIVVESSPLSDCYKTLLSYVDHIQGPLATPGPYGKAQIEKIWEFLEFGDTLISKHLLNLHAYAMLLHHNRHAEIQENIPLSKVLYRYKNYLLDLRFSPPIGRAGSRYGLPIEEELLIAEYLAPHIDRSDVTNQLLLNRYQDLKYACMRKPELYKEFANTWNFLKRSFGALFFKKDIGGDWEKWFDEIAETASEGTDVPKGSLVAIKGPSMEPGPYSTEKLAQIQTATQSLAHSPHRGRLHPFALKGYAMLLDHNLNAKKNLVPIDLPDLLDFYRQYIISDIKDESAKEVNRLIRILGLPIEEELLIAEYISPLLDPLSNESTLFFERIKKLKDLTDIPILLTRKTSGIPEYQIAQEGKHPPSMKTSIDDLTQWGCGFFKQYIDTQAEKITDPSDYEDFIGLADSLGNKNGNIRLLRILISLVADLPDTKSPFPIILRAYAKLLLHESSENPVPFQHEPIELSVKFEDIILHQLPTFLNATDEAHQPLFDLIEVIKSKRRKWQDNPITVADGENLIKEIDDVVEKAVNILNTIDKLKETLVTVDKSDKRTAQVSEEIDRITAEATKKTQWMLRGIEKAGIRAIDLKPIHQQLILDILSPRLNPNHPEHRDLCKILDRIKAFTDPTRQLPEDIPLIIKNYINYLKADSAEISGILKLPPDEEMAILKYIRPHLDNSNPHHRAILERFASLNVPKLTLAPYRLNEKGELTEATVIDLPTSSPVTSLLTPLENPKKIIITANKDHLASIQFPRLELDFEFKKVDGSLRAASKQFPDYFIAENQQLPQLPDINLYLILEKPLPSGEVATLALLPEPNSDNGVAYKVDPQTKDLIASSEKERFLLAFYYMKQGNDQLALEGLSSNVAQTQSYGQDGIAILESIIALKPPHVNSHPRVAALQLKARAMLLRNSLDLGGKSIPEAELEDALNAYCDYLQTREDTEFVSLTEDEEKILIRSFMHAISTIESPRQRLAIDRMQELKIPLPAELAIMSQLSARYDPLDQTHWLLFSDIRMKSLYPDNPKLTRYPIFNSAFQSRYRFLKRVNGKDPCSWRELRDFAYNVLARETPSWTSHFMTRNMLIEKIIKTLSDGQLMTNDKLGNFLLQAVLLYPDEFPKDLAYIKNFDLEKENKEAKEWVQEQIFYPLKRLALSKPDIQKLFGVTLNPSEKPKVQKQAKGSPFDVSIDLEQSRLSFEPVLPINPEQFLRQVPPSTEEINGQQAIYTELKTLGEIPLQDRIAQRELERLRGQIEILSTSSEAHPMGYEVRDAQRFHDAKIAFKEEAARLNEILAKRQEGIESLANQESLNSAQRAIKKALYAAKQDERLSFEETIRLFLHRDGGLIHKRNPVLSIQEVARLLHEVKEYLVLATHQQHLNSLSTMMDHVEDLIQRKAPENEIKESIKQLGIEASRRRAYNIAEHPEYLVLEYYAGIRFREAQVQTLDNLKIEKGIIKQPQHLGKAIELIMGAGKTSVISPLLGLMNADGERLAVSIMPKVLIESVSKELQKQMRKAFDQTLEVMEFSRNSRFDYKTLERVLDRLTDIRDNKKVLLIAADSLQSLFLKMAEKIGEYRNVKIAEKSAIGLRNEVRLFLEIFQRFKESGIVLIDEADTILDVLKSFHFTLDKASEPYLLPAATVKDLYRFLITDDEMREVLNIVGSQSQKPFSTKHYHNAIKPKLVEAVLKGGFSPDGKEWQIFIQTINKGRFSYYYISEFLKGSAQHDVLAFVDKQDPNIQDILAVLKEELNELLPLTIPKNLFEHFGPSSEQEKGGEKLLAQPFHQGRPATAGTQFGTELEVLNYTLQMYLKKGVSVHLLKQYVGLLEKEVHKVIKQESSQTLTNIPAYQEFLEITGHDPRFKLFSMSDQLYENLKAVVDADPEKILHTVYKAALPELNFFEKQLNADAQLFGVLFDNIQAMTGTLWNSDTFPAKVTEVHPSDTAAKTLALLWKNSPQQITTLASSDTRKPDWAKELIRQSVTPHAPCSFIDSANLFRGVPNRKLAQHLLEIANENNWPSKGVVFYDEQNRMMVLTRHGEKFQVVEKAKSLLARDELLAYWDQSHTTGSDIKLSASMTAAVSVSRHTLLRDLLQAVWRLRGLASSQKVHFVIMEDDKQVMQETIGQSTGRTGEIFYILKEKIEHLLDMTSSEKDFTLKDIILYALISQSLRQGQDNYRSFKQKIHAVALEKAFTTMLSLKDPDMAAEIYGICHPLFGATLERRPYLVYARPSLEQTKEKVVQNEIDTFLNSPMIKQMKSHPALKEEMEAIEEEVRNLAKKELERLPDTLKQTAAYGNERSIQTEQQQEKEVETSMEINVEVEVEKEAEVSIAKRIKRNDYTPIPVARWPIYLGAIDSRLGAIDSRLGAIDSRYIASCFHRRFTFQEDQMIQSAKHILQGFFGSSIASSFDSSLLCSKNLCPAKEQSWLLIFTKQEYYRPFGEYHKDFNQLLIIQDKKSGALQVAMIDQNDEKEWKKMLLANGKNEKTESSDIRLALYDLSTGIYLQGQKDDRIIPEALEGSTAFKKLKMQAKFLKGEINYSREEQKLLEQWLSKSDHKKMKSFFIETILPWADVNDKDFAKSDIARLFRKLDRETEKGLFSTLFKSANK